MNMLEVTENKTHDYDNDSYCAWSKEQNVAFDGKPLWAQEI